MRVQRKKPIPHFVSLRDFCRTLGLYHAYANRLITLGILEPDGFLNSKPIFSADMETIERAKARIADYKAKRTRAQQSIRELAHV
jgi:hypothetical protein